MNDIFGSEFFSGNRARLRELFTGTAPIVITAHGQLQRSGDTTFPFRQDSNFWYLTGIDEPDIILVIDKAKEYLIIPVREDKRALFDGAISIESLARRSGISTILDTKEGWKQFGTRLRKVKHVATIAAPPRYLESYGMYTNPARSRLINQLKEHNNNLELLDVSEHLVRLRMTKQPQEIAAIKRSIAITSESLKAAMQPAKRPRYAYEYEIEAEITRGFRKRGAKGHAFDPIVAAGKNATTIHYLANNAPLSTDELVTIDIGAEFEQYAADITRTIPLGAVSRRQQQILDTVADVQSYAFGQLRPGVRIRDFEDQVEQFMGEKLRELGLIKTIDSDQVRKYYPHATSHHLGLNVHDVADYNRPLEPNMVITVEPGIYIPEEEIGVRIEDDVIITDNGIEVITSALPTRLD
jgi:Xaa-Pro aminopeptidase